MIYSAGVDFGNFSSVIAIPKYDGAKVLLNQSSSHLTPTMVTFSEDKRYSGILSSENQIQCPQNTITNLSKTINLKYDSEEAQELSKTVAYNNLIKLNDGTVGFEISHKDKKIELRPEQCVAFFFKELKSFVKADELKNFVITVNPQSNEKKLRSIITCCKIAQIQCISILKSSTAAAISYVIQNEKKLPKQNQKSVNVAFVDIGETGMTVSVAELKQQYVHMKSTNYTEKVNGSILTQLFERYLSQKVKEKCQIDPTEKIEDKINFSKSVENAKKKLSIDNSCNFEFKFASNVNVTFQVTRKEFNDLFPDVRSAIEPQVIQALQQAKVRKEELSEIQILGGSSCVVSYQTELKRIFGKKPKQPPNFDQCLAIGCAYMADFLSPKSFLSLTIKDYLQHSVILRYNDNQEITIFKKFIEVPAVQTVKVAVKNRLEVNLFDETNERIARIEIQTNIQEELNISLSFQLSQNCITTINNCFYVKNGNTVKVNYLAHYDGEFEEAMLDELKKIECDMEKVELDERNFSEAKKELNSQMLLTDELISNNFYDYIDPSIVDEVKDKIEKIQSWAKENENNRLSPDEYKKQTCELKNITTPVAERMNKCKNSMDEITALKNRAIELHEKFNNKVDPRILASLTKFAERIENILTTMKYKDVSFNVEKNKSILDQLANNLENLCKKK